MKRAKTNFYETIGPITLLVVENSRGVAFKFLIDTEDLPIVSKSIWRIKEGHTDGKFYAVSQGSRLHQLVTGFKWGQVDHIDRDTMDNRKSNLRESNKSLNNANGLSKYRDIPRGVILMKSGKYQSRVRKDGQLYLLGTFLTSEEAHKAYVNKHKELFKEHSIYN